MRKPLTTIALVTLVVLFVLPLLISSLQKAKVKPKTGFRGIRVLMPGGEVQTLELEDYLVGVVAAEMPASFETEALKAQAVAARTYAVRKLVQADRLDQGYDVDTTEKTQAWISEDAMHKKWGVLGYLAYKHKVSSAVKETKSLVLTHGGAYVQAFFFSSAGRLPTERAEEVWGASLPYLTNVEPEQEEASRFVNSVSFTAKEIDAKIGTSLAKKSKISASDVRIMEKTSAGRVKTVQIGGKLIQATQLRVALNLKSTDFTIKVENNRIVLTAYGNGHAVGMSQYGANSLAKKGTDFQEILLHYYPGSEIMNIN